MNPLWDAAQAILALALECLGATCDDYGRVFVETSPPVADCSLLAVVIGNARARSGSCVGRIQLTTNLDVTLIRCCDPLGDVTVNGYTPPTPAQIEAAVACLVRDAWQVYECIICQACDTVGNVQGVTSCCDKEVPPPEIIWGAPSGGCRSAIIRVPVIVTVCCPDEVTP